MEALRAGRNLRKLIVARTASASPAVAGLVALARRRGVPIQEVPADVLQRMARTRTPQGVIALAAAHAFSDLDAIVDAVTQRGEAPFLLLLDGIEDPDNLGAIVRSADAAGIHCVVIPKHRAVGLTPAVAAASAGSIEHVPVAQVTNLSQTMEGLKRAGVWVIGADADTPQTLYDAELVPPIAIVIGGEGRGLSRLVRERCDRLVRIPMHGRTGSLNASVAAGILLFEVRRQWMTRTQPRA